MKSVRGNNPVVMNPYSTGTTLQLIPRAAVDEIPVLSMGVRLVGFSRWQHLPVGLHPACNLLGWGLPFSFTMLPK